MSKDERFERFQQNLQDLRDYQLRTFAAAMQPIEQDAVGVTARILAAKELESWWALS